ncbi:heavy-metal-associated domain-containing protein [Yangia mangrovi]|uniref:Heavy-metal-associated domain-containing protein n=1 Tax=Alloyangia mangrovi TaxID=1779329 RepID=A0A2A3JXG7_9RHOB|nr:heavy-metal-associated domain-containing protein [Alloyangia mangrovi]MCT4371290.1 heavy-metal-associated domain-containing protein [Alloyangia mangrovi]
MSLYRVEDMSCGHCVATIKDTVAATEPMAKVACDLPSKTISITGASDEDAILQSLKVAGYAAVPG